MKILKSVLPALVFIMAISGCEKEDELDDRGQEIQLSSGLELKFDAAGEFLRIDS